MKFPFRNYRPRRAWTSRPLVNSLRFSRRAVIGVAIHWVGPPVPRRVLAGDEQAVASYLRGVQRFHTSGRGWSDIAYNLAVDSTGRVWNLRGLSRRSAANGDTGPNARYVAVVALVGEGQQITPAMERGLRRAIRRARWRFPMRKLQVVSHAQIRPEPTACPGPRLRYMVRKGMFK